MADRPGRALAAKRKRASKIPDWGALPDEALFSILERVPSPCSGAHFLVCKRWCSIAKHAQRSLHFLGKELEERGRRGRVLQRRDSNSLLRGVMSRFPNLSSVHLVGCSASDSALQALTQCQRLVDLRLESPRVREPGVLTPAGLARGLGSLTGLHSLSLSLPTIPLPASVSSLQHLKSLSMVDAAGPLPDSLGALPSLTSLSLEGICWTRQDVPQITALPASLWQLSGLQELRLYFLPLADNPFPPQLGNLSSLRRLTLLGLRLTTLGEGLTRLFNLEELKLTCYRLEALPAGIQNLKKLRSLHLQAIKFSALPPWLCGRSASGETLGLQDLRLSNLGHEIEITGGLSRFSSTLRHLSLEWFKRDLPDQLGCLSRLQVLRLMKCPNKHLPESLGDLTSLEELHIKVCLELQALPRALGRCPRLRVLDIYCCHSMETLPEDIGSIPALRELHLSDLPSLSHLPQSLAHAKELQQLTIKDCPQAPPFPALLDLPRLNQESRRALRLAIPPRKSLRLSSRKGT